MSQTIMLQCILRAQFNKLNPYSKLMHEKYKNKQKSNHITFLGLHLVLDPQKGCSDDVEYFAGHR